MYVFICMCKTRKKIFLLVLAEREKEGGSIFTFACHDKYTPRFVDRLSCVSASRPRRPPRALASNFSLSWLCFGIFPGPHSLRSLFYF